MGRGMSAVQEAMGQGSRGLRWRLRWPWCWPLLAMPTSLIIYVVTVLACDLALTGWKLAGTPLRAGDLLLLVALPPVILLQRSLMHQQLAAAARTDPKTGLLNATAWQREADAEVVRALRTGTPLALLLMDVDHFKRVNDNHGHLIGDEVLRALAVELRRQVRESDVVGRFGGEEFTVLLPGTDDAGAYGIAERLRASAAG